MFTIVGGDRSSWCDNRDVVAQASGVIVSVAGTVTRPTETFEQCA